MPRIRAELIAQGVCISLQRFASLMLLARFRAISRRRGSSVTKRRGKRDLLPNDLVMQLFMPRDPSQYCVADMTYVPT